MTLWLPNFHKNAVFNCSISFLAAMTLNGTKFCWKRYCLPKNTDVDFPKIIYKNLQHFNLVHTHKPKLGPFLWLLVPNFFIAFPLSFFLALLPSLPFELHILSDCCQKLGVNYWQSLGMGTWSIKGHFTNIFAPKLMTFFLSLLCQNTFNIQNWPLCR